MASLLDDSFDFDPQQGMGFTPLVSSTNVKSLVLEDQPSPDASISFFGPTFLLQPTSEMGKGKNEEPQSPISAALASVLPRTPAPPQVLIDFVQTPSSSTQSRKLPVQASSVSRPPPLVLPSPSIRARSPLATSPVINSAPRSPSPLKQVSYGEENEGDSIEEGSGAGAGQEGEAPFALDLSQADSGEGRDEVQTVGASESPSPVKGKKIGTRWGVMTKLKKDDEVAGGRPSLSPKRERGKGLSPPSVVDHDASALILSSPTDDYSLLLDQRGSFLLDSTANFTMHSMAAPKQKDFEDEDDANTTSDMKNLLRGLDDSSILAAPSEDDEDILNASTVSYRDYRDSPRRRPDPLACSTTTVTGTSMDEEQTPIKKRHPLADDINDLGSGSRSSDSSTPTASSGRTRRTESSGDVNKLLTDWDGDEAATTALYEQDPPSAVLRQEPTATFEKGPETPLKSAISTSSAAVPPVIMSPRSLFGAMRSNSSRDLESIAKGKPRTPVVSGPSAIAGEEKLSHSQQVKETVTSGSTGTARPPTAVVPSGTDVLKRKMEELRRARTVGPPPAVFASNSSNLVQTPSAKLETSTSRSRPSLAQTRPPFTSSLSHSRTNSQSSSGLGQQSDNDNGHFSSASSATTTGTGVDSSKENKAPPVLVRSNSKRASLMPTPAVKSKILSALASQPSQTPSISSPRKESTQARLDKAREERKKREALAATPASRIKTSPEKTRKPLSSMPLPSSSKFSAAIGPDSAVSRLGVGMGPGPMPKAKTPIVGARSQPQAPPSSAAEGTAAIQRPTPLPVKPNFQPLKSSLSRSTSSASVSSTTVSGAPRSVPPPPQAGAGVPTSTTSSKLGRLSIAGNSSSGGSVSGKPRMSLVGSGMAGVKRPSTLGGGLLPTPSSSRSRPVAGDELSRSTGGGGRSIPAPRPSMRQA
ncbi:hypothetical protein T439DRAFT_328497 [Meredithblackwellia eburnea MCA 4105]